MTMKQFLDGFDLLIDRITMRFRRMMQGLVGLSAGFELLTNTDMVKLPPDVKWPKWVTFGAILLAYYTRSKAAATVAPTKDVPAKGADRGDDS